MFQIWDVVRRYREFCAIDILVVIIWPDSTSWTDYRLTLSMAVVMSTAAREVPVACAHVPVPAKQEVHWLIIVS